MSHYADLIERLRDREKRHRECIANSQVVVDLLRPQMDMFNAREGGYNTYAVRMSVDHQSSIRTTTKEADELRDAADAIAALTAQAHPAGDDGGWREIESAATRKGFECLVRNDRGIFVAWFDPEWADVGWWLVSDGKNDGHPLRGSAPTHWMPLPIDPTTGTSQDQGERG